MVRLINSIKSLESMISLMLYIERKVGKIPEQTLIDIKKAVDHTTFGMRLRFLECIKNENLLVKYFVFFQTDDKEEE